MEEQKVSDQSKSPYANEGGWKSKLFMCLKRRVKEKCPIDNDHKNCRIANADDCVYDKSNCEKNTEQIRRKRADKTPLKVWLFIVIGLLVYVTSTLLSKNCFLACYVDESLFTILSGVSISLIAGAVLTYIIDIPSKLHEYETTFLNALTSNNYIRNLDEDRLIKLRKDVTEQLHANTPHLATGLIEIDQKICDLLKKPYYTYYRHSVTCSKIDKNGDVDEDFIAKTHMIEYLLKNPYGENKQTHENISFEILVRKKDKNSGTEIQQPEVEGQPPKADEQTPKVEDFISDISIDYCTDDQGFIYIKKDTYRVEIEDIIKDTQYYNSKISLHFTGSNESQEAGMKVSFHKHLKVRIKYTIKIIKDDICFTKRLKHPVKNFRLDYSHNDPDIKLCGQLFGTDVKQSNIAIKYINDNTISLETFDWILPENGAIVFTTRKTGKEKV